MIFSDDKERFIVVLLGTLETVRSQYYRDTCSIEDLILTVETVMYNVCMDMKYDPTPSQLILFCEETIKYIREK